MRVPFFDAAAEYRDHQANIDKAILDVVLSGQYINGYAVDDFENRLADYLEVGYAVGMSSGTDALLATLMAMGIGPGDTVLVPDYTFAATAEVVLRVGATPIIVDVDYAGNMFEAEAIAKIGTSTKAAIVVHLFGKSCEFNELKKHVTVIEDCAQSLGTLAESGEFTGTQGVAGCFSFFPSKNLGCMGDAGAVCTNDMHLAEKLYTVRRHGQRVKNMTDMLGGNFRLDTLHAAVLHTKMLKLPRYLAARRKNAEQYIEELAGIEQIETPDKDPNHTYNQFVILSQRRDLLRLFLESKGIDTAIYYPYPLSEQALFRPYWWNTASTAHVAKQLSQESLALPVGPFTTPDQISYVCETIRTHFKCG